MPFTPHEHDAQVVFSQENLFFERGFSRTAENHYHEGCKL